MLKSDALRTGGHFSQSIRLRGFPVKVRRELTRRGSGFRALYSFTAAVEQGRNARYDAYEPEGRKAFRKKRRE